MDINKILNADYLDILYEGRNKGYGGYELRKKYQRRAAIAGLISLLAVGGIFASTLIKPKKIAVAEPPPIDIKSVALTEPPPIDPKTPPPPPITEPPPPVKPTVKFTPPVIKENNEVKAEDKPEPPKPEKNEAVGPTKAEGSGDPNAIDPGLNTNPGTGKGPAVTESGPPKEDQIFTAVEQLAEFPGGNAALQAYLANNIKYPMQAREDNIQGKVALKFVVDRDGSITSVTIVRDIGGGCGQEAVRVVKGMPKWKPAKQGGNTVRSYYNLPVSFKLSE
jgi:protein TonB